MFGPVNPLGKYKNNAGLFENLNQTESLLRTIIYANNLGLKPLLSIQRACGLATSGYYVIPGGDLTICYLDNKIKPTKENRSKAQKQGCLLYDIFQSR